MQRSAALFLQAGVVLLGLVALVFLIWEPTVEGVNANAASFADIYLDDPFLAYMYAASIAFFFALYKAFKVFGYAGEGRASSPESLMSLRAIKYCAFSFAGLVGAAVLYLSIFMRGKDDIAGGVAVGLFVVLISLTMATTAMMFERKWSRV